MNVMHGDPPTGPWLLEPARRRYAWGSVDLLPDLLGEPADGEPLAELWYGAHPAGSATLPQRAGAELVAVVHDDPASALGAAAEMWNGTLPFMVKLIAAARPLSIQVHPDYVRAARGFAAENERGLASDDPDRRYQDGGAKPEIVCALGQFDALIDFRPTIDVLDELASAGLTDLAATIREGGFAAGVRRVLSSSPEETDSTIAGLVKAGNDLASRLADVYPGDPGVIIATFLNRVRLEPGDAVFLAPGSVHAYLSGLAIEVMATSDNVLRAGLTSKLVDVDEFLAVARLEPAAPDLIQPDGDGWYPARTGEFDFARHTRGSEQVVVGPAVVLCTQGRLRVGELDVAAGEAAFVGADATGATVSGPGDGYVATVGTSA